MRKPSKAVVPIGPDPTPELIERTRGMLARARTLDEVLHVRGIASGYEKFFKAAGQSHQLAQEAVEVRLRAERRAGEILIATGPSGSGERAGRGDAQKLQRATFQLSDLGIEKTQSHRWQRIASVPARVFERYIKQVLADIKGELTTQGLLRIAKETKREDKREENRKIVEGVVDVSAVQGSFSTIVIDPPWDWGDEGDADQLGRARPTYATMPLEEIAAMPVGDLAATNSHIYLWITNRSLPKGFELLEQWGFRYVTALTWCKPSIGMGNYFRGSTEHVLFGVRGSLELLVKDQGTWFAAKRPSEHSQKPVEFYRLVEKCSPGPWLEIFSRQQRKGWVHWGESGTVTP